MPIRRLLTAFLAAAACSASPARAATVTLPARADATIFQNNPANGSGRSSGLFAGTNGASSPRRALVAFDLAAIPAGSVIESAQLTLYLGQVAGSGGGIDEATIGLHRVAASWGEGETQLRTPPSDSFVAIGQGAPAEAGDVTWNDRFFTAEPSNEWTQPGGDFATAASATLMIGPTLDVPYVWPSTTALVADVQHWVVNPAQNFGWMLVNRDESSPTTLRAFYSRDAATTAFHPALTIAYSAQALSNADFDGDSDVDGADLLVWQRYLGVSAGATRATGDANGDGAVTGLDLAAWRQGFGSASPEADAAPEPATAELLLVSLAAFVGLRRR